MNTNPRFASRATADAFTLVETVVTMSIFTIAILAIVTANIFGLHAVEFIKPKLGASEETHRAVNRLTQEVRTANLIRLGDGDLCRFTEVAPNSLQQGSAIQIYPTTNASQWVRYYWDASDRILKRTTNGENAVSIVATSVSNAMVFSSEDFAGNILTNNQNNRVIGLTLQFYQIQYPVTPIGQGYYYDFYQLRTCITRRSLL